MVDTIGFTDNEGTAHEVRLPKEKTFTEFEKLIGEGRYDEVLAFNE